MSDRRAHQAESRKWMPDQHSHVSSGNLGGAGFGRGFSCGVAVELELTLDQAAGGCQQQQVSGTSGVQPTGG